MEHYYTVKKWQFDEQYDFRSSKYSSLCTLEWFFFVTVAFLNISPDSVHFLARDDQPKPSATTLESWTKRRENLTQSSNLLALENTTRERVKEAKVPNVFYNVLTDRMDLDILHVLEYIKVYLTNFPIKHKTFWAFSSSFHADYATHYHLSLYPGLIIISFSPWLKPFA